MNEHNLEFYVPDGATVNEGQAMTAGGQPVNSAPFPKARSQEQIRVSVPASPGRNAIQVVYTLPYTGSINIDPKSVYPLEHFVAIAPKSIEFCCRHQPEMLQELPFSRAARRQRGGRLQHEARQRMAFKFTGEGTLWRRKQTRTVNPRDKATRRRATIVPAEDLVLRSTLPIRCRNIAGGFLVDSRPSW